MSRLFTIIMFIFLAANVFAQQMTQEERDREKKFQEQAAAAKDTTKPLGWAHNMVTGVNLTQISFTDWAQGGENALSYTAWLNGSSVDYMEMTTWSNVYKFAFGQTRLGSQGLRKTDDEIYYETLFIYRFGLTINPYASATFRTQFTRGYKYDNQGVETPVSNFFDPAYLTQSLGLAYTPMTEVKTRIGFAMREVLTSQFTQYANGPGSTSTNKTKVEGGLESVTDVEWKFAENMLFTSRLELFAPLKTLDQIIVRNDNTIAAKVNKYVTVSFNLQLINDVTVTPLTQVKQVLAIGLSYQLL